MIKKAAAAIATVLILAGCGENSTRSSEAASTTPSATPTPTASHTGPVALTMETARARYLAGVCPANAAKDALIAAIDKYDSYDDDEGPSRQTRKALRAAAEAYAETAQLLVDDNYTWPKKAKSAVERIATYYYETSAEYSALSERGARWDDVESSDSSETFSKDVARVRLMLTLPPAGEGCEDLDAPS